MCPDGLVVPARDIWANGVLLAEADHSFAPEDLRLDYDEYYNPPPRPSSKDRPAAPAEIMSGSSSDPVITIAKNIQQLVEILAIPSEMRWDMRNRLLRSLGTGEFVAYGYAVPRNPTSIRSKIPRDLFDVKYVKWEDSSITGAGLAFASVLIFESGLAQEIDAHLVKKPPTQGTGIKRGPPPSSAAIEEAIKSLLDEGWRPNNYMQKENIETVKARVHKLHPGEFPKNRGLSKESIRKVLANLIPRIKN
jgi:hypothetical protein